MFLGGVPIQNHSHCSIWESFLLVRTINQIPRKIRRWVSDPVPRSAAKKPSPPDDWRGRHRKPRDYYLGLQKRR